MNNLKVETWKLMKMCLSEVKKQCFKCLEFKPLDSFYKHSRMRDGHLNKCKTCTKADVSQNYHSNREHYVEYETTRRPLRKPQTNTSYDPLKRQARIITSNAIRTKKLIRNVCEVCGEANTEAHHEDYTRPLEVQWLCRRHHLERHGKTAY